jgi:hypothetical protein
MREPVDVYVHMYKKGMVVEYGGFKYEIATNIISDGELYLTFAGSERRVNCKDVVVPITHFVLNAPPPAPIPPPEPDIDIPAEWIC